MPSLMEGFGIAAAEAMAMRKPVVASAVEGITGLVQDGVTGSLVAPGDPAALAGAMISLLSDSELRALLGDAGRRHIAEAFSIQSAAAKLEALYERTCKRG